MLASLKQFAIIVYKLRQTTTESKKMTITKKQAAKVEAAKREHMKLLNKELTYSEDLQDKEKITRIRANIAKLEKMIKEAA